MPATTPLDKVLQKMRHYCAYQERCHQEVLQKAVQLGAKKSEANEIAVKLIEDGFLNEERFAIAFAGGKFRIKKWGRNRIVAQLKARDISSRIIDTALREIDEESYQKTFAQLAEQCWDELKGEPTLVRKKKCHDFLLRKGYESEMVRAFLSKCIV